MKGFWPKLRMSTVWTIGFQRTLTPATVRSSSGIVRAPDSLICWALITVTDPGALEIGISVLVAAWMVELFLSEERDLADLAARRCRGNLRSGQERCHESPTKSARQQAVSLLAVCLLAVCLQHVRPRFERSQATVSSRASERISVFQLFEREGSFLEHLLYPRRSNAAAPRVPGP